MKKPTVRYLSYFRNIVGNYLFYALIASVFITLSDSIGIGFLVTILQYAAGGQNQITGESLLWITDLFKTWFGNRSGIKVLIYFAICMFVFKGLMSYLLYTIQAKMTTGIISKTRLSIIHAITGIRYEKFTQWDTGTIQNISTAEVTKLSYALQNYLNTYQYVVMTMVYIVLAITSDPVFSIAVIAASLVVLYLYNFVIRYFKQLSVLIVRQGNKYNSLLSQLLHYFKYLKATDTIVKYDLKLRQEIDETEKLNHKFLKINAFTNSVREPLILTIVSLVILYRYTITGEIRAEMIFTLLLFYRTLNYALLAQSNWQNFHQHSGSIDHILQLQQELKSAEEKCTGNAFTGMQKQIELKNIHVILKQEEILKNISCIIPKNTTIALAGPSGSGKTTLISVISTLITPQKGEFEIDGRSINEIDKKSYRERIGYVAQDPVIFNDTIFNNITLWSEKDEENLAKFEKVCRMTHLDQFIRSLENREDTVAGAFGITLSGGQKQRICIARELFRDVEIIIFDEATASLDAITEQIIRDNLQDLAGQITIIIITHRLSTIKNADQIIFLNQGRIEQTGTYQQLMQHSEKFRKMAELQSS